MLIVISVAATVVIVITVIIVAISSLQSFCPIWIMVIDS